LFGSLPSNQLQQKERGIEKKRATVCIADKMRKKHN